jgi:hypothetical protein
MAKMTLTEEVQAIREKANQDIAKKLGGVKQELLGHLTAASDVYKTLIELEQKDIWSEPALDPALAALQLVPAAQLSLGLGKGGKKSDGGGKRITRDNKTKLKTIILDVITKKGVGRSEIEADSRVTTFVKSVTGATEYNSAGILKELVAENKVVTEGEKSKMVYKLK